jgi:hypothetical protein
MGRKVNQSSSRPPTPPVAARTRTGVPVDPGSAIWVETGPMKQVPGYFDGIQPRTLHVTGPLLSGKSTLMECYRREAERNRANQVFKFDCRPFSNHPSAVLELLREAQRVLSSEWQSRIDAPIADPQLFYVWLNDIWSGGPRAQIPLFLMFDHLDSLSSQQMGCLMQVIRQLTNASARRPWKLWLIVAYNRATYRLQPRPIVQSDHFGDEQKTSFFSLEECQQLSQWGRGRVAMRLCSAAGGQPMLTQALLDPRRRSASSKTLLDDCCLAAIEEYCRGVCGLAERFLVEEASAVGDEGDENLLVNYLRDALFPQFDTEASVSQAEWRPEVLKLMRESLRTQLGERALGSVDLADSIISGLWGRKTRS